ncbi:hypothetical protein NQ314_020881 [Rhamnusium bicolor]|uniref:Peptidase S1 domain-containing protein n=1 Tax=Rhamnusium bicolor TaxID=1586634 RepID=A0AAV8WK68_9CUCU|nr:hypothetical protein NQ314_020881 [Rhamnusium bicolor]
MDIKYILTYIWYLINLSMQNLEPQQPRGIPTQRIIDGNIVYPHSIPYQVFLNFTGDSNTWLCGGSLITTTYVLTAGRCCFRASSVEIILGAHNISERESTQVYLESSNITIHPDFKMDVAAFVYQYDIAVIYLPESVTLNEVIQTIKLPTTNNTYVNNTGKVGGWGLTDPYNNISYSSILLAQENMIISNEVCSLVYYDLKDYDICMKTSDTLSPCVGDYGSPLVVDDVQVGIVSQGVMFCIPGYPFIYTRVTSLLEWIKQSTDYIDYSEITTSTSIIVTTPTVSTTTNTISTTTNKDDNSAEPVLQFHNLVLVMLLQFI